MKEHINEVQNCNQQTFDIRISKRSQWSPQSSSSPLYIENALYCSFHSIRTNRVTAGEIIPVQLRQKLRNAPNEGF